MVDLLAGELQALIADCTAGPRSGRADWDAGGFPVSGTWVGLARAAEPVRGWLRRLRVRHVLVVLVTLAAGADMMIGGHLFATRGWAVSSPAMTPAGPLISVGFALAAGAEAFRRSNGASRARLALLVVMGLPAAVSGISTARSMVVAGVSLVAGLVMAVGGYGTARWNLWLAPPLVIAGGLVIAAAFAVAARGQRLTDRSLLFAEPLAQQPQMVPGDVGGSGRGGGSGGPYGGEPG